MATQIIEKVSNGVGGYDLIVERDMDNPIRILTGNKSLKFWTRLRDLCNDAIFEIESKQKRVVKRPRI